MKEAARFAADTAVLNFGVQEHRGLKGQKGYDAQAQQDQRCADRVVL